MPTEIELNQEFDLFENRRFHLILPGAKYPNLMDAALSDDVDNVYDRRESIYDPIVVPAQPELGYPIDMVDAHFRGLEEKLQRLDPEAVKTWPQTYLRLGGLHVSKIGDFRIGDFVGKRMHEVVEDTNPNNFPPMSTEELRQMLRRIFLTVTLKSGSYVSPNMILPSGKLFGFRTFKPTEIASLKAYDLSTRAAIDNHVFLPISDGQVSIKLDRYSH